MKKVWVLDDDKSIRWILKKALSKANLPCQCFSNTNEAINQLDDLYASMPSSDLIKGINLGNSCWKRKFKNCDK